MPGPATKLGSLTAHGGTVIGPGCPTVMIEKVPAIRVGADMHVCPMVNPGVPPIPHVGMNNIGPGVPTVLIGKMPASTVGDNFLCVGPPAPVVMGATTVMIGTGAGGGGGGGGGAGPVAQAKQALKAGKVKAVEGTENYPLEVQATAIVMQQYCTPEGKELDLEIFAALAEQHKQREEEEKYGLTIADFVEILQQIEADEGYEAARFFASHLDYSKLCELTRAFVTGENTNEKNDPNQMPTRFMLLYGADDNKLQQINDHPDRFEEEEHKITVANLRKALILLGHELAEEGPFDDEVWQVFVQFLSDRRGSVEQPPSEPYIVQPGEDLGTLAQRFGLASWKYLYELNKEAIGDNPDILPEGIELEIPHWDTTTGDEKIEAKNTNPFTYTGGLGFRYPWVPFSLSLVDSNKKSAPPVTETEFAILDPNKKDIRFTATVTDTHQIKMLVPDVPKGSFALRGYPLIMNGKNHIHPEDLKK